MYKLEGVVVKVQLPQGPKLVEFLARVKARESVILQMKDEQLAQPLEGLVAHRRHSAVVQVEGSQMLPSYELVVDQSDFVEFVAVLKQNVNCNSIEPGIDINVICVQCMNSLGAYQVEGSGVHGNELWDVGVLAVAALNYVGGPSLQR